MLSTLKRWIENIDVFLDCLVLYDPRPYIDLFRPGITCMSCVEVCINKQHFDLTDREFLYKPAAIVPYLKMTLRLEKTDRF